MEPSSETASSSSPAPPPRLSLRSPALQAEFLQKRQNKARRDLAGSSAVSSSSSPSLLLFLTPALTLLLFLTPALTLLLFLTPALLLFLTPALLLFLTPALLLFLTPALTLLLFLTEPRQKTSPELLSELRESRSLRRVGHRTGLTTVFCGRGSQASGSGSGSAPSTQSANQKASSGSTPSTQSANQKASR
ncbi:hypothetical protein CgunFtcFv8_005948 [Champsocephalus gunnari]|uniref:Transmembrane protein n=1 Tax=Champsocephalus gunnari TaxID=52237 RepID=A0AAN8C0T0_CHAGU|nr:hypothetical protein CgunFtcFv8_005948 [Champsocephalus gunnari]